MDSSDFPVSKSPRRELQGARPAPLKVRKDSYKIKKPPVAPPQQHHQHQQKQQPPRQPVIIYTVSPKVIQTNPNDFMMLVQRLTGSSSTASDLFKRDHSTAAISPAARYASIEKTKPSPTEKNKKLQIYYEDLDHNVMAGGDTSGFVEGIEMDHIIQRSSLFPGILSPGPTSLPMIPPTFFSPPSDPNTFSFLHDLSPVLHGNKNYIEGSFMPSPSTFISPLITSPTLSFDFFNNFFDF